MFLNLQTYFRPESAALRKNAFVWLNLWLLGFELQLQRSHYPKFIAQSNPVRLMLRLITPHYKYRVLKFSWIRHSLLNFSVSLLCVLLRISISPYSFGKCLQSLVKIFNTRFSIIKLFVYFYRFYETLNSIQMYKAIVLWRQCLDI